MSSVTKSSRKTKEIESAKPADTAKQPASAYEPSAQERAVLQRFYSRQERMIPTPRLKVRKHGENGIEVDHPDPALGAKLLMETCGTGSYSFVRGLCEQLADAAKQGSVIDEDALNFMLAAIRGINPRDEVESMLAAQMAGVHMATMTFVRRLASTEIIEEADSAERVLNKLARTFTTQVEALKRYRTGGEQRVTVEHVHVHSGGQAIVGNVAPVT